jgi:hypothetical protein
MIMKPRLRLVADNPNPVRRSRPDGRSLRRLADRLTEQVQCGNTRFAHLLAVGEHLNPLDIAVVASQMYRAGLTEDQIIAVVA